MRCKLTNIIWGETDDHIVPFPDASEDYCKKKECSGEAGTINSSVQKAAGAKFDIDGRKLESSSKFDTSEGTSASGVNIDQWPRLSLSTATKTDQDSFDTSMPNSSSDITTLDSSAGGKEQGDFVDYGWASIGSFDDLDRIFSNGDPIFGNVNLGNGDDLWSSSKDITNSPVKPFPISMASGQEYAQEDDQLFSLGYGKMNDPASRGLQNTQTELAIVGKSTTTNSQLTAENVALPNELTNKFYRQKKLLKGLQKAGRKSQQKQLQGPEQLQHPQLSNPFVFPSAYRNMKNPYSMTVLSHIQSGEFKHQPLASGYEVSSGNANPINNLADCPVKPQRMTPQEKIEKLRRRQQIQAMLAIQEQQQQLVHQKCSQENQIQHVEGADLEVEDLSTLASFDPNSPIEQDDSNTISLAVNDGPMEDTILYRLQEMISKLDVRIRLCIRDSLLRLAQSAMQGHYGSDTRSTNNSSRGEQVAMNEETSRHSRMVKMPEEETDTNPIDRTVAHLLFHRPVDFAGKHPESPVYTRIPCEHKTVGIAKLSMGSLPDTPKSKPNFSQQSSKRSSLLTDFQPASQCKSNPFLDTSEDASNNGPADEGAREVKASE
ncbi:PROTEIN LNK2 [Salix purpurea]|uniref:PROTEIN LNK2 n=1 Tax=Salix purpurea TaxID=77065 RepID=A0A9Q0YX34_SALPP|nr:PROTEIN LNK2 [Salix purpurea]KAJ6713281.1 PROTEIN LNK2 [Salix purpurea]